MSASRILRALEPVVRAFEILGIAYQIGGSVASSAYGIARATIDVDLVTDMNETHVQPLVERLRDAYYIDEERVRDAVARRTCFNVIHFESMLKIDVFVMKTRPYDRVAFARVRLEDLGEGEETRRHYVSSPEDVVLNKLDWYRQGGCVSDRQWSDVQGILKVQLTSLDLHYMQRWAVELGLSQLLQQAFQDAGLSPPAEIER